MSRGIVEVRPEKMAELGAWFTRRPTSSCPPMTKVLVIP